MTLKPVREQDNNNCAAICEYKEPYVYGKQEIQLERPYTCNKDSTALVKEIF